MPSDRLKKRSVNIAGHLTSITLEDIFWETLKTIAQEQGLSRQRLIENIDKTREGSLSSALRVYVLKKTLRD